MKEILIRYVPTYDNVVDLMTKVLPLGERRDTLVERLLYDITSGVGKNIHLEWVKGFPRFPQV
jgi:hypothetical protein